MSRRAYYAETLSNFLKESADSIVGKITQNHPQNIEHLQTSAWRRQIEILHRELKNFDNGHVLFEVLIPRMGRRADTVLIYKNLIFVLEFKVGATEYSAQDVRQTHGYALDLSCFHEGSHNKTIVPILVATNAQATSFVCNASRDQVFDPIKLNQSAIRSVVEHCVATIHPSESVDVEEWLASKYKPTPNIIEAAKALYSNHDVQDM
jgi:hypothetical protein